MFISFYNSYYSAVFVLFIAKSFTFYYTINLFKKEPRMIILTTHNGKMVASYHLFQIFSFIFKRNKTLWTQFTFLSNLLQSYCLLFLSRSLNLHKIGMLFLISFFLFGTYFIHIYLHMCVCVCTNTFTVSIQHCYVMTSKSVHWYLAHDRYLSSIREISLLKQHLVFRLKKLKAYLMQKT